MRKPIWNRVAGFVLSAVVAVSGFAGAFAAPQQASANEGSITVAQAIANNSGAATVEGYVVAHTTGTNAYDFTAPFANDFNFAIADSASETSAANMLPVQLTTAYRAQFGLMTNPAIIGKKVRVTGTLGAYFSVPGLKAPTAMEFVDGGDNGGGGGSGEAVRPIAEAKALSGQTVTIEGVVTADNAAIGGGRLSTYVQDATGGINVFAFDASAFPALTEGQFVQIKGQITSYNGLTEIVPASITVKAEGQPLPEPLPLSLLDASQAATAEPHEGKLVTVRAFVNDMPSTPAGGGYNVPVIDENYNGMTLRVMAETNVIGQLKEKTWYDFTGVLSQYDSYQLLPRKAADAAELNPQPPAPAPESSYVSTVKSVVDGDTVHLTTPVLGVTKVRMLSIDTPEKNYEGQSQGYYADAATEKLLELLPPGTEVEIEPGSDPIDGYGRLLAHIRVKSTGLDVNKEMVKTGFAVNYFIWPNMSYFEEYSAAAKEAIENGYGMHNPENPIPQLPYQFRFELRGGPDKFVGDYFTKTYVAPDKWMEVPTENRVFFFTEQEAQEAGYVPEASQLVSVQLLSVNDLHGKIDVTSPINGVNYGRADYLAAYLKQREATNPNTLIVHPGDMVGASSPVSALLQDEPTVEIMEAIGFDVGTVGNHEFDEGVEEMLRLINGGTHPNGTPNYDGINFPMVAANVEYKDNGELVLPPYTIKETGGVKIGFIGVVTTETPNIVIPEGIQSIRFTDETAAINKYVPELKEQGVETIIVLAHNPGDQSGETVTGNIADIAAAIDDEVDVIFSAHNHQKNNGMVDGKLIVQAWEYGKAIGDVDLLIDPATGEVVSKKAEIIDVVQTGIEPDAEVAAILKKYGDIVAPKLNEVIGETLVEMTKGYPTKAVIGDDDLGNFLADAMKWSVNSDFALMNGGGVRDNINAGPITWGELFNVQPFGNTVVRVNVTGEEFEQILNAMINPRYGPDSFIAGASYSWDADTKRVKQITLPNGQPIDKNATYSLAVNNYMYEQTSDKYRLIAEYGDSFVQGPIDVDATVAFLRSIGEPIAYEAEGRISTDVTAPVTSAALDGLSGETQFNDKDVTLVFSSDDGQGIGVLRTEARINGGQWQTVNGPLRLSGEGMNRVEYRSVDKIYNVEPSQEVAVAIDKTAPEIDAHFNDRIYLYEEFLFAAEATDVLSGTESLTVEMDGKPMSNPFTLASMTLETGVHKVIVTAADYAGNMAKAEYEFEVMLDIGHLDELVQWGLDNGKVAEQQKNALLSKIDAVQKSAADAAQNNQLEALINHVKAQAGKRIDAGFAEQLIKEIRKLQSKL
ncbi:5'-nucleotidase C-terminal domain-containing protein [Paenibacillus alkalitolerans]|uniref:5'-nucleotidase C-terminal domain-containing protein n=1 Tax=Paenibacillus alkalitolerans TaxID=2799335 RepID=UPI0018F779F2|nr:5'-nucleotidase C-terminal domain-containing protein [Paenibacillus alkalitolerans]